MGVGDQDEERYRPPPRRRLKIELWLKIDPCKYRTGIGNTEGISKIGGNNRKRKRKRKEIAPRAGGL